MIVAELCQDNIILNITARAEYQLERKIGFSGSWEPYNGSSWGGVPTTLSLSNFTDYDLLDGIYQYRYLIGVEYTYSNCIFVGGEKTGWTFRNYEIPEGTFGEILTPDDIRYSFMWGIDFVASNGESWIDAQTQTYIEWAVYQIEKMLNINIFPITVYCDDEENSEISETKTIKKEFPYPNRRKRQYLLRTRRRPILEVTRFDWYTAFDTKIADLMNWTRVDREKGFIYYYPKSGQNIPLFTASYFPQGVYQSLTDYPGAYHVDYRAGFANAEMIPEDLREIIGKIVAMKMLNVIGDGLLAGFSSSSLSLDGMSESFSSTQSATNAYFGARLAVYKKDVQEYIQQNKYKYGNFVIGSI